MLINLCFIIFIVFSCFSGMLFNILRALFTMASYHHYSHAIHKIFNATHQTPPRVIFSERLILLNFNKSGLSFRQTNICTPSFTLILNIHYRNITLFPGVPIVSLFSSPMIGLTTREKWALVKNIEDWFESLWHDFLLHWKYSSKKLLFSSIGKKILNNYRLCKNSFSVK